MEIVLVRHGQPEWTRDGAAVGDPGLTGLGRGQAERVAGRVASPPRPTALLVSTARRSLETAVPVAAAAGLKAQALDWLHEIRSPGDWDGTPAEEVERVFREVRTRSLDEWWDGLPGGESFRDFHVRVCDGLQSFLAARGVRHLPQEHAHLWHVEDADQQVVIIAHSGTNSVILGHLLGLEPVPWEWERFFSLHASVSVLRPVPAASAHVFSLRSFSDVGHLPPEQVTG